MQANLSRIHHIIKSSTEEFNQISAQMEQTPLQYTFKIFEKTQEEDFEHFKAQLAKRKKEFENLRRRTDKLIKYIEYLRNLLAEANEKYGINAKLAKASSLGRKLRQAQTLIAMVEGQHAQQMEPVQKVDFYKTAYTEQVKVYELPVYVFTEDDLDKLRKEHKKLLLRQQEVNDEIAGLNQTHSLEIETFEEFLSHRDEQITV